MVTAKGKVPAGRARIRTFSWSPVLLAAHLAMACGGEVESAPDRGSRKVARAAESGVESTRLPSSHGDSGPDAATTKTLPRPDAETGPGRPRLASDSPMSAPAVKVEAPVVVDPPAYPDAGARFDTEGAAWARPAVESWTPGQGAGPQEHGPERIVVPAGTRLIVAVEEAVSTRDHRRGDRVYARTVDDVLDAHGMVLVPLGTRLAGVVSASEPSHGDREAVLDLRFEELWASKRAYEIRSRVLGSDLERSRRVDGRAAAGKVAAGAAVGALLGKLLGDDDKATIAGAVAGAAAGGIAAVRAGDGHAVLEEGGRVRIELLEPVTLQLDESESGLIWP